MRGEISYTNPRGFFFISVKDSNGFISRFFGLRSRIIRGMENLAIGAICDFTVAEQPSPKFHGSCQEADRIDIIQPAILPPLSSETATPEPLWAKDGE
jgi:hypothetical protein